MSIIEYVEPFSGGEFMVGIGSLIMCLTMAYIFYKIYIKFSHFIDVLINREIKYELVEESFLERIAKKNNIDLNKELIKRKILEDTSKKSFRKKLQNQVFQEMFEEKTK